MVERVNDETVVLGCQLTNSLTDKFTLLIHPQNFWS